MRNKITIADIAKEMGIAASTVSRALNNSENISETVRKNVWNTAKKMGYDRGISQQVATTIAIIVPAIDSQFYNEIITTIYRKISNKKYNFCIYCSYNSHEQEVAIVNNLNINDLICVILSRSMDSTNSCHLNLLKERNIPIIMFNRIDYDFECPKFVVDNYTDAYMLTEHAIKNGYKRIAIAAKHYNCSIYKERIKAYEDALEHNGIEFDKSLIMFSELTKSDIEEVINHFLSIQPEIDALLLPNYFSVLQAIRIAKTKGISIPSQLGLLCFDEEIYSQLNSPSITTIDRPLSKIGEGIGSLLLDIIQQNDYDPKQNYIFSSNLVIRGSSLRNN